MCYCFCQAVVFFLLFFNDDRRIRIREAQKHWIRWIRLRIRNIAEDSLKMVCFAVG